MGYKRFTLGAILVFLLVIMCASAKDQFYVVAEETYTDIFPDEEAVFPIEIVNDYKTNESFYIKFGSEVDWIINTVPTEAYYLTIPKQSSKQVSISVRPKDYVPIGRHRIGITVQHTETKKSKQIYFDILLKPIEWKKYLPRLQLRPEMNNDIDPRNDTVVRIHLKNLNRFNITNLNLILDSQLIHKERTIQLPGLSKTTEEFLVEFDKLQEPMKDKLTVTASVTHENKTYSWETQRQYKVVAYSELVKNSTMDEGFLKTEEIIQLKNKGNVENDFEIKRKAGFFERLFTRAEPGSGLLKTKKGTFLYWKLTLEPEETTQINITRSYRTLAAIIVLIIIGVVLYYVYRPPVLIKKEVSQIGTSEGGISEIKILLHLKSRTRKALESLSVVDKVPHIAEMGEEFQVGTIKPTKVVRTKKKGTLVKWEIPTLDPYEERIITYKLKSRLSILGGLVLPPALVKFQTRKGKEVRTKSNRVTLEL